jgi:hypothetical protein
MEILDLSTGERLAAAVDGGIETGASSLKKWDGSKEAIDRWAKRLETRFAVMQSQWDGSKRSG